jgi:hypothetical protein
MVQREKTGGASKSAKNGNGAKPHLYVMQAVKRKADIMTYGGAYNVAVGDDHSSTESFI